MNAVLVIAETRGGQLRDVSQELIAAGAGLAEQAGAHLAVAVIDDDPKQYLPGLAVSGIDEVLLVPSPVPHFEAHVHQAAVEALLESERPDVILASSGADALGWAAAFAAKRGLGFASDVASVDWSGELKATRGAFGGKLVAEVTFPGHATVLLMLRSGVFSACPPAREQPPTRLIELALEDAVRTRHLGFEQTADSAIDITKAPFLLSIGRGVEEQEDVARFEALAERLGGTLSVSRPLVDAGWVSSARQVGQSGKSVTPRVYLALGISGSVQHLAGMRGSDTIIAVNTDPDAPIFSVAHYGVVADLFEVTAELERLAG